MKKVILAGLLISVSAQAQSPDKAALQEAIKTKVINNVTSQLNGIASQIPEIRKDLGEHFLEGEVEAIDTATVDVIKTILHRAFTDETPGIAKGDHGKGLACLKGAIKFHADIPEHLQRGVVKPNAEYAVDARISNAETPGRSDRSSTSQGIALKLKSVSSQIGAKARLPDFPNSDEQDFLMTSATTFFLSNIMEYSIAFGSRNGEKSLLEKAWTLITNPRLFGRVGVEIAAKLRQHSALTRGNPDNIMTHPYWSKHPYAWGEAGEKSNAVKYSVEPCDNAKNLTKTSKQDDYQKEFISEAFGLNQQICFHLRVQTRPAGASEKEYPIEDGNVEWNEQKAPFVRIATVVFNAADNQGWRSAEAQAACVKTEFSPWNGLMAHQPMSNLARGRRYVYKASALVREQKAQLDAEIQAAK